MLGVLDAGDLDQEAQAALVIHEVVKRVAGDHPELLRSERRPEQARRFQVEPEQIGDEVHPAGERRPVVGARAAEGVAGRVGSAQEFRELRVGDGGERRGERAGEIGSEVKGGLVQGQGHELFRHDGPHEWPQPLRQVPGHLVQHTVPVRQAREAFRHAPVDSSLDSMEQRLHEAPPELGGIGQGSIQGFLDLRLQPGLLVQANAKSGEEHALGVFLRVGEGLRAVIVAESVGEQALSHGRVTRA